MFDSILIVCVGNVCRSPMAEKILEKLCPEKKIASAGLKALVGHPADMDANMVAKKSGLTLDGHVARQITPRMCVEFDLILVMERAHLDAVSRLAPEVRGKTMLFGHWLNELEIPDPYRRSKEMFCQVYYLLNAAAEKWASALNR